MDVTIHVVLLYSGRGPLKWHCWKVGFFGACESRSCFEIGFYSKTYGISSETHDSNVTVFASWTVWIEFRRKQMTEREGKKQNITKTIYVIIIISSLAVLSLFTAR